ncbi:DUF4198 domain-containing protein [Ectothiorhodospiraceae bacterium BW-2]|nr:DUF4198 domain-containing protein [Ectothiorhodospiraceae bacterium BW-2]
MSCIVGMTRRLWLASLLLTAPLATAHDFWIEPTPASVTAGESVSLALWVGQHFQGTTQPYIPAWFRRFEHFAPDGSRSPIVGSELGDDPAARLTLSQLGSHWIIYSSEFSTAKMDRETFTDYVMERGLEYAVKGVDPSSILYPVSDRYRRCAKALIRAASDHDHGRSHSAILNQPLGLELELVLLNYPLSSEDNSNTIELQLLYQDRPLSGVTVTAQRRSLPKQRRKEQSDSHGRISFTSIEADDWLFSAVHLYPHRGSSGSGSDWESLWASLRLTIAD